MKGRGNVGEGFTMVVVVGQSVMNGFYGGGEPRRGLTDGLKMVGAYDDVPAKSCGCELRPRIDDVYSTWRLPSHIKHSAGHRCKAPE